MDKITFINLSDITTNKLNLRNDADKNNLEELAESIKAVGLINPITVRPYKDNSAQYEIVSGERRFKAAELAGLDSIPAIIRDLDDDTTMEIIITENLQRKEIHPLDEASGFNYLLNTGRYTPETIADKVGKSKTYVIKRLKFIQLSDAVRDMFREGQISLSHALEFGRLNEKQQEKMLKWMENHKYSHPTANDVKEAIQREFYLKIKDAVFDIDDDLLLDDLPTKNKYCGVLSCKMCPKRTGFNTNLFDDITDDVCTDPECYDTKVKEHIRKTLFAFADKGKPVIAYQHTDAKPKDGVYTKLSDLVIINRGDKKCDSIKDAIVTKLGQYNWGFEKQVGETFKVCIDPNCNVHKRDKGIIKDSYAVNHEPSEADKKKIQKQRFDREVEELTLGKAAVLISKKVKYPLDDIIIAELTDRVVDLYDVDQYLKALGLSSEEIENITFEKYLDKKTNIERLRFLAGYLAFNDSQVSTKLCKKFKIDVVKLKKEARTELKLREKEQAKAVDMEIPENEDYESNEDDKD